MIEAIIIIKGDADVRFEWGFCFISMTSERECACEWLLEGYMKEREETRNQLKLIIHNVVNEWKKQQWQNTIHFLVHMNR